MALANKVPPESNFQKLGLPNRMGRPSVFTFVTTQSQVHPKESTTSIHLPWQMQYGLPLALALPLPSIIVAIITRGPQLRMSPGKGVRMSTIVTMQSRHIPIK
jgi:hypothetical protein